MSCMTAPLEMIISLLHYKQFRMTSICDLWTPDCTFRSESACYVYLQSVCSLAAKVRNQPTCSPLGSLTEISVEKRVLKVQIYSQYLPGDVLESFLYQKRCRTSFLLSARAAVDVDTMSFSFIRRKSLIIWNSLTVELLFLYIHR